MQRENRVSSAYLKKDRNQLPLERSRLNVPFDDVLAGVSSASSSASLSGGSVTGAGVSTTGCRSEFIVVHFKKGSPVNGKRPFYSKNFVPRP